MDVSVVFGVATCGELSRAGESGFAGISLGLRLMSLKSELFSFCLQSGHVR